MAGGSPHHLPGFDHSLLIRAAPSRVIAAFFDPKALAIWWQAIRSVTIARPFGVYAIEWAPSEFSDEVLGHLGGVFHGTVVDVTPGQAFFVADAWWLPPEGEPVGPMGLEVTCVLDGPACRLHVEQHGFEDSLRWRRYYEVIGAGWHSSLAALKRHLEIPLS
jgi:uncharacterized protein YndB with AHSA1/START domain